MARGPFMWGRGGAALTPEQVAREREIAQALMRGAADTSPVGHWTQGAARMAQALVGNLRDSRAASAEAAGQAEVQAMLLPALTGSGGGDVASLAPAPVSGAAPATVVPSGDRAQYIRTGLVDRGLAPHIADAFIMNFQDESGLDPGINERNPIVPGSRGGFGLYQLTGPRRRAYEAFAAERGVPASDTDAQLDFLMTELRGPESAAAREIMAAQDTGTAAAAIVNRFLRPAESHRARRASRYMSAGVSPVDQDMADLATAQPVSLESQQGGPSPSERVAASLAATGAIDPNLASGLPPINTEIFAEEVIPDPAPAEMSAPVSPVSRETMAPVAAAPMMQGRAPVRDTSGAGGMQSAREFALAAGSGVAPIVQSLLGGGQRAAAAPAMSAPSAAGLSTPMSAPAQQPGGNVSDAQLMAVAGSPWASKGQRDVAMSLLDQRMKAQDPMRQLQMQKLQHEVNALGQPSQTAEMQNLAWRAEQAGLIPGSPEYQQFMAMGGAAGATRESEAVQKINRMAENLVATGDYSDPVQARNVAAGIVDGRLRSDRHPVTGALQVVDMATGQPVYPQRPAQTGAPDATPAAPASPGYDFGTQFPNAQDSFGITGAAQGAINRATDTLGLGPAYPDVAQTQSDFAVLRESVLNDVASSYGRQPPSWLLKEIRDLTPEAGSVFQGAGTAQTKLRSLGRHLSNELQNTNSALQRELSPQNRQEMEARQQGLISGIERVNGALQSFERTPEAAATDQGGDGWTTLPNGVRIREVK